MLGIVLKEQREKISWSIDCLANRSGVSSNTIKKIEKGQMPTLKTLTKILRALCLNIDDLLWHDKLTSKDILYLENKKNERLLYERQLWY